MPKRSYSGAGAYRYGFNGKENDNEVKGLGNQQDYGMRIYDPRIGKFLSVDPLQGKYPELTPYQFSSNSPIDGIDLDGLERVDQRLLLEKDGTTQLLTISTGPTEKRYFTRFWRITKIPNYYRVEFNEQHYIFSAQNNHADIRVLHEGNLNMQIYSLEEYNNFINNPDAGSYTSIEQASHAAAVEGLRENAQILIVSLATRMPYAVSTIRRSSLKSRPSTNSGTNDQAKSVNNGNPGGAEANTAQTNTTVTASTSSGKGEYGDKGGHHIHAQAAFKANLNYDSKKGFSISQSYMNQKGWNHQAMTNKQRELFKELSSSGRPNTLTEHTNIAVKALQAGGASLQEARSLVAESLNNLRQQGVTVPSNIPWYK